MFFKNQTDDNAQDKRCVKTKKVIRNAMVKLITESDKDISKLTVTEISREANINRKTFYAHYQTVPDAIECFKKDVTEDIVNLVKKYDIFSDKFKPVTLFDGINSLIENDMDFYRLVVAAEDKIVFAESVRDAVRDALLEMSEGKVVCNKLAMSLVIDFMLCGIACLYKDWLLTNKGITLNELSQLMARLMWNGMRNVIGYK